MNSNTFKFVSKNLGQTYEIAQAISKVLKQGDVVLLNGGLGTGKTYFVKAFVKVLGSVDPVTSPTFTIANFYESPAGQILHIDTYRIDRINEFRQLGLFEYFSESITFVEWGEKIQEEFESYLELKISYIETEEESRNIELSFLGDRWNTDFLTLKNILSDYQ